MYVGDVTTISRLQLINTLINTFFSRLHTFLAEQRKQGKRPMMVKRKLDGAVDGFSADQEEIRKSDTTGNNL